MIIIDTNVLSETMRPAPVRQVLEWLAAQPVNEIFTTAVTQAEILSGIAYMPAGKRKHELQDRAEAMFREDFDGGILAFDTRCAPLYAEIVAAGRAVGHRISEFDAQIAAIARLHSATLATRNIRDFAECGIRVVNPWEI